MSTHMSHQLYVFGSNGEGQLGMPVAEIVKVPTCIANPPPLDDLKVVKGGDNHTIMLTKEKAVFGTGSNHKSQLRSRIGSELRIESFENLGIQTSFLAATCESSAYIIQDDESMQSRIITQGFGRWGELGRGDDVTTTEGMDSDRSYLCEVLPGSVVDFAAGVWHYVAILGDGSMYGWGKARHGQLGGKASSKVTIPTRLEDLPFKPIKAVCGKDFTYVVGDPQNGHHVLLGQDKFNIDSAKPPHVQGWKQIGCTWYAIYVLLENGTLKAWGKENLWKLLPPDLPLIDNIAVGSDHVLAATKDGKLISWGWGKHGNCGDLKNVRHPIKNHMVSGFWNEIPVPGETQVIAAGFCTSFVIAK